MDSELPHGVMFHHFCEDSRPNSLGAITPDQLENIIASYKKRAIDILPAEEWYQRALMGSLNKQLVGRIEDMSEAEQIALVQSLSEKNLDRLQDLSGGFDYWDDYDSRRKFNEVLLKAKGVI